MSLRGVLLLLRNAHMRRVPIEYKAGRVDAAVAHEEFAAELDALIHLIDSQELGAG